MLSVRDWITTETERSLGMVMDELSPLFGDDHAMRDTFANRLEAEYERIFRIAHELYGWRWDFSWHLLRLLKEAAEASMQRKKWLRRRDALDAGASWLTDPKSVWAMGYLDRFVGDVGGLERALPHLPRVGSDRTASDAAVRRTGRSQ